MSFWTEGEWTEQIWLEVEDEPRWWEFWRRRAVVEHRINWKEGASPPFRRPNRTYYRVD